MWFHNINIRSVYVGNMHTSIFLCEENTYIPTHRGVICEHGILYTEKVGNRTVYIHIVE